MEINRVAECNGQHERFNAPSFTYESIAQLKNNDELEPNLA